MKKIKNTSVSKNEVVTIASMDSYLFLNRNVIIDLSFPGAFMSIKHGNINSYLQNERKFIAKFRCILKMVSQLSAHNMNELLGTGYAFRHCHKSAEQSAVMDVIGQMFSSLGMSDVAFEQELGDEEIYQMGFETEERIFGTIHGNIFRVYFIDYFHEIELDERRNTRNEKGNGFCAITSPI